MTTTATKAMRNPTYDGDATADGFELCEDFDVRSSRTFDRAAGVCERLEREWYWCEFELRFAWAFSFGRPGEPPGVVPQIQIWTRLKAR